MRVVALLPDVSSADSLTGDDHTGVFRELLATGHLDDLRIADDIVTPTSATADAEILLVADYNLGVADPGVIRFLIDTVRNDDASAALATRPVTDTIKRLDPDGTLHTTWDRDRLRELRSPLCCRRALATRLGGVPGIADLPPDSIRLVADTVAVTDP